MNHSPWCTEHQKHRFVVVVSIEGGHVVSDRVGVGVGTGGLLVVVIVVVIGGRVRDLGQQQET